MTDPWSAAWEESETTNPAGIIVYNTLELQHPAFVNETSDPIPIRVVAGVSDDTSFGIEIGAVFNAGEMAPFQAIPFSVERSEVAEGRTPECEVIIDGVGRELTPYLEAAITVKADLLAIYREYLSDDLTEPAAGPIEFVMRRVRVQGTAVIGTARLDDLANRKFPFKIYSPKEFPGLVAS